MFNKDHIISCSCLIWQMQLVKSLFFMVWLCLRTNTTRLVWGKDHVSALKHRKCEDWLMERRKDRSADVSLWEYGRMFAYLAVVIFSSKLHQGFFRQMKTSRGRFSLAFFRRWSLTGLHFTFRSNQIGFTRLSFKTLQRALKTLSGGRGSFSDLNSDHMLLEWIGSRNFHTTFRLINTWRFPRWRCVVHFSAVAITTAGESDCEERKWANVTKLKAAASDTFTLKQVLNSCVPTVVTVGGRLVDKSCFSYEKYIFW